MKNRKTLMAVIAVLLLSSLALAACAAPETVTIIETVVVTEAGETIIETVEVIVEVEAEPEMMVEPVTLYWNWLSEPPTLDPSLATDTTSVAIVGNTFIGVTQFNVAGEVSPSLATSWESGEDADGNQTWTFHLREDIAWVKYDPVTGETTQEVDADGNPRFANANDVVYGVKRTVDPATASDYSYVLYIVKNAADINGGSEELTLDDLGVVALDDTTVQFTLERAAGYFPAIAGMWIAKPMPQWAIEEWGDTKWTEAGLIVTNGPYSLESWIHGGELNLVKNPLWVDADSVQIERIQGVMIVEQSTAFALYENGELDASNPPLPEMDRVKADPVLSEQLLMAPRPCTYYYGFTNTKPPFDDARVRAAFVQSIDRQSLIDNVLKGGQIPATSFGPPGMFGAPAPGTVGLPYDVAAANASLQAYLDENGMTVDDFNALGVTLMHNTSEGHANIAAAIQQMWADNLGVTVTVENQEWKVYLKTLNNTTPLADAPHIWRMGWCADYPDENNWIHEVFNSDEGANDIRTSNADFNALTVAAAAASDPAEREALYLQAETLFHEEMVAIAPIYHYTFVRMTQPWLTRNHPPLGGPDFYNWSIDVDARGH